MRPAALLGAGAHVVAVSLVVARRHGVIHRRVARRAPHQPLEQRAELVSHIAAAVAPVVLEHDLDLLPLVRVHDGLVLALVDAPVERHLAEVDHVREEAMEPPFRPRPPLARFPLLRRPRLRAPATRVELARKFAKRLVQQVELEHLPNLLRLFRVYHEAAALGGDVVAERRHAADPLALLARGRQLVARPLGDDLPLELREGQQDVQGEPAHARGRVELLCHGHEADAVLLEVVHDPGEVEERARQPIHLVDDDAVDPPGGDVRHEALERRALGVAAGETAVVVPVGQRGPAFGALAEDVCLGRLTLGVERVEFLLQALLGGLAGVDGAADGLLTFLPPARGRGRSCHEAAFSPLRFFRAKKS